MRIIDHPSPNCNERRDGLQPQFVVLHYTAMDSCRAARDRLCDPSVEVSAHYLIDTDGTCLRLVDEGKRAWHAGQGHWRGLGDMNSRSIGIELDNPGDRPFAEAQMCTLEALLPGILTRWSLGPEAVIGHSDMAPARKQDPGARFDWRRLALGGMSVWPDADGDMPSRPDEERFFDDLARFGYDVTARTPALDAFRLRFRPHAAGQGLDAYDQALAAALASGRFISPGHIA